MRARRAESVAIAEEAADHHTAAVPGQELHILRELRKAAVPDEILLNVRDVEGRHLLAALGDELRDGRQCMLTGGVADNGHDEVAPLEPFHVLEGLLGCEEIRLPPRPVFLEEQLAVGRMVWPRRPPDARVAEVERIAYESVANPGNRLQVERRQRNTESPNALADRRLHRIREVAIGVCGVDVLHEVLDRLRAPVVDIAWDGLSEQKAEVLDPVARHRKKRLEEKVLEEV